MEPIIGWRIDSNMGKESLQMHDKKLKRINRYTKMIRHDRKKNKVGTLLVSSRDLIVTFKLHTRING